MKILIGARFLQKVFNNVLVKKLFLKAKENVALISNAPILPQYCIKIADFWLLIYLLGIIGNKKKEFFFRGYRALKTV